ncbi:cache domain-containing protein [Alkaliphilus metalliredigens]|uniref:cache domain-containing protein n=1 Tax=Alkaliphilus metalliredigens TaxID=208226 RepID=UPI00005CACD4|nr:cache domain-containing protein [Alkaliphilus metalliredigens]
MKSLKSRLIIVFTLLIFILVNGLSWVSINLVSNNSIEDAHENLKNLIEVESRYIASRRDQELNYIDALAQHPMITEEEISFQEKIAFFEKEAKRTGYAAFAFADKRGNSSVFNSAKETTNIGDRAYFTAAFNGQPAASDILISRATGEMVIIYAAPVIVQGEIIGVFYGRREGTFLSDIVNDINYGETGYAYVINNEGTIVADKDLELVLKQDNMLENAKEDESFKELASLIENQIGNCETKFEK